MNGQNIVINSSDDSFAYSMCFFVYIMLILGFFVSPLFFFFGFLLADLSLTKEENQFYDKQCLFLMRTAGFWFLWVIIAFALLFLDIGLASKFDYSLVIKETKLDQLLNYHPIKEFLISNESVESLVSNYFYKIFGLNGGDTTEVKDLFNISVLQNLWYINYKEALFTGKDAEYHLGILLTTIALLYIVVFNCIFWPIYRITYGSLALLTKSEIK